MNAMEILPNVMGIISKPRFFPMYEKDGTFNNNKAPVKPNTTKTIADIIAFTKVVCNVGRNELLLNKSFKPEKLKPKTNGNNTKRVTQSNPMVNIRHKFIDGFMFTGIKVFFLFQSVLWQHLILLAHRFHYSRFSVCR